MPRASTVHAVATVAWVLSIGPTLIWWRDSLLWVIFMSLWANVVSHASAYEAARAKEIAVSAESDH
jgi:hypothetical protein